MRGSTLASAGLACLSLACLTLAGCGPLFDGPNPPPGQTKGESQYDCAGSAAKRMEPAAVDYDVWGKVSPDGKHVDVTVTTLGRTLTAGCTLTQTNTTPPDLDWTLVTLKGAPVQAGRYVVVASRWMTDEETKQWLTQRLSPRAGEFAGQTWG